MLVDYMIIYIYNIMYVHVYKIFTYTSNIEMDNFNHQHCKYMYYYNMLCL